MPVTRRRRAANPPEQPENTVQQPVEQDAEGQTTAIESQAAAETPSATTAEQPQETGSSQPVAQVSPASPAPVTPEKEITPAPQPEERPAPTRHRHQHVQAQPQQEAANGEQPATPVVERTQPVTPPAPERESTPPVRRVENVPYQPFLSSSTASAGNGERVDRQDYTPPAPPPLESGRRTSFRRPVLSQQQQQQQAAQPTPPAYVPPAPQQPQLQPPSHEISLPLGNLLHLAYNPGYTGAEEARSALLQQLVNESKAGGRARCWSCSSLAIVYDRWNTRSKTFGEVGVAFCEICGVWSVM